MSINWLDVYDEQTAIEFLDGNRSLGKGLDQAAVLRNTTKWVKKRRQNNQPVYVNLPEESK